MSRILFLIFVLGFVSCSSSSETNHTKTTAPDSSKALVGGGCDGCELMYIGMPEMIAAVDTSPGWNEPGQKLLINGTVYQADGKTPAPGVIIYYWQTDHKGYYSPAPGQDEKTKRHGHIRSWVKTDAQGKYSIYTIRPAPYPNEEMPAHVHTSVKEPGTVNEYYVDEFVFDDDPLLTAEKRKKHENRGGSGILKVTARDGMQVAEHTMVLGLNVPHYPVKKP